MTIIDYGLGNIRAFYNIYSKLNISVNVASKRDDLLRAQKLILPGVGAFDWAMNRLNDSGLRETIESLVLEKKVPILGICVGMQMMTLRSEEGVLPGLGWFDAEVIRFTQEASSKNQYLPHMGWNDVKPDSANRLFSGIVDPKFYFLHSYFFSSENQNHKLATTNYGINFTSAAVNGHIYGVQFHPEKSHEWGIKLLKNFSQI
ncbi:imidazole glycerol phosphate synthase subunit HisH [Gammaproteobacteria bacterium]|nr:imidazole glycerol phosphate synthase subunit HisH [Gammaproteobacteria bacterium]